MCSASEYALRQDMMQPSSTIGWDDVPTEIFLYIFKKLDITSLRCCFSVSKKWREIVTCLCELQDLWQALAEDGMVNHGVTQRHKSILSWKDLFLNSFLWKQLPSATAYKIQQIEKKSIKSLHVYNDKLIVVDPNGFEYYDIETMESIRHISKEFCVDVQESDDILMVVNDNDLATTKKVTVFIKLNKDEEIDVHNLLIKETYAFPYSWSWRLVGNRVYVIDARFSLWECAAVNKSLDVKGLARFYGDISSNSIHVINKDVYISVAWGGLLVCAENSRVFRKVNALEIPTKVIEGHNLRGTGGNYERIYKFNAFIKYPFNVQFLHKSEAPQDMIHYHYEDPEMTVALQHGDAIFRGFEDGRIAINLLRDDYKHDLIVQQFDRDDVTDPAVRALEICELKVMHKLFVATSSKLYTVLLKYPERGLEI